MIGRGASRYGRKVRAAEFMLYGDVTGCDVGDHLRNEEGIVFGSLLRAMNCKIAGLLLECVETADTGCENHADTVLVYSLAFKTCILDCLIGCLERVHRVKVKLTSLLAVEMRGRIEILNLACELGLEFACVEVCNRGGTALACLGVIPSCGHIVADRSQRSESRYYNSL